MSDNRSTISWGGRRIAVDAPHLAFVTFIAVWCVWFGLDAFSGRADVENLIMIVPGAIVAFMLYFFVAFGCFHVVGGVVQPEPSRHPLESGVAIKLIGSMALLVGLVAAGPILGFDAASFLYILAMLLLLGERRIAILLLGPVIFCVVAVYGFNSIVTNPLPLLFFRGAS